MRLRPLVAVIALAAVTLIVLFLGLDESPVAAPAAGLESRRDAPVDVVAPAVIPEPETAAPEFGEPRAPDETEREAAEGLPADARSHGIVRGRIWLTDADGVRRSAREGRIRFDIRDGRARSTVKVSGNRFRLFIPRGATITPAWIELDGQETRLLSPESVTITEDVDLLVKAEWPHRGMRLHVQDAETGAHLERVTVIRRNHRFLEDVIRPPIELPWRKLDRLVVNKPSPIEFPRLKRGSPIGVWVGAEGYAWATLDIDRTASDDRFVRLFRPATIAVSLFGLDALETDSLSVRLRPGSADDNRMLADEMLDLDELSPSPIEITEVPPGDYRVAAELGEPWDPLVFGEARVTVAARSEVPVAITIEAPPANARVPLAGTIELPPAWHRVYEDMRSWDLSFHLQDDTALPSDRVRGCGLDALGVLDPGRGTRRFEVEPVGPGTWSWHVWPMRFEGSLVVGEEGVEDARIVVPPPTTLTVHFIDAETRRSVGVGQLEWSAAESRSGPFTLEPPRHVRHRSRKSTIELGVPPGFVALQAFSGDGHDVVRAVVEVGSAPVEVTLELRRTPILVIGLRNGAARVLLDADVDVTVTSLDGEVVSGTRTTYGGWRRVYLARTGRYVVDVVPGPGFLDPAPVEVHVTGLETHVVVPVTLD